MWQTQTTNQLRSHSRWRSPCCECQDITGHKQMAGHAIIDTSRRDAKDGIRHLPQVRQYVCKLAGQLKNKFCSVWNRVAINFRITLVHLAGQQSQIWPYHTLWTAVSSNWKYSVFCQDRIISGVQVSATLNNKIPYSQDRQTYFCLISNYQQKQQMISISSLNGKFYIQIGPLACTCVSFAVAWISEELL